MKSKISFTNGIDIYFTDAKPCNAKTNSLKKTPIQKNLNDVNARLLYFILKKLKKTNSKNKLIIANNTK